MTIKQQGGIFGRNPTFNDVGASTVDTTDLYANNISVGTDFQIEPVTLLRTIGNNANAAVIAGSAGAVDKYATIDVYRGNSSSQIGWTFNTYYGSLAEAFTVTPSGNLAFPSGQGIDFSATAGGSGITTSEIFDDYEEGTFTVSATRITDLTTNVGRYTKVGNLVTCEINLSWTATDNSGNDVIFTGLPFTSATGTEAGVGPALIYGTDVNTDVGQAIVLRIDDNQTRFFLHTAIAASLDSVNANAMNSATTLRSTFSYTAS